MKAMVLAAGLGTRLRPLTFEIPKPMVPVLDRPVMAHILDLLQRHGVDDVIANLHYFPDTIRDYFGGELEYRYEEELLGTAGGVRGCRDYFGDDDFVVISGDALTDVDLPALFERHRSSGGIATLTVKRVTDTQEYGVIVTDEAGRITGFQEKPQPEDALSDLANAGIYVFRPEIFDHFPDADPVDWAHDVFPKLLERDVPFHVYETDAYWNDVGSLDELRNGTFDALNGELHLSRTHVEELEDGLHLGSGSTLEGVALIEPPVWVGDDVHLGKDVRLQGPVVIGDGATIGDGASVRDSIVFPGTEVPADAICIGAVYGHAGITASLRPRGT